ncbi:hypothetical protein [Streptomyces himastatinicus]|uniref:hypothetical protein n=1 Tax=Streptomyces himastatinicus TaxID=998084 RepID=UPI0003160D8B|nr:hypothetical protein [Streptomyces himastatinicus]
MLADSAADRPPPAKNSSSGPSLRITIADRFVDGEFTDRTTPVTDATVIAS